MLRTLSYPPAICHLASMPIETRLELPSACICRPNAALATNSTFSTFAVSTFGRARAASSTAADSTFSTLAVSTFATAITRAASATSSTFSTFAIGPARTEPATFSTFSTFAA